MLFNSIKDSEYIDFAKEVYCSSFPKDERRDFDLAMDMVKNKDFDFFVILSNNETKPIGIISLWEFDSFVFMEHFAIDKPFRNKHYGTKAISHILEKYPKPFIIEVEPPTDAEALKRINFYKHLGFNLLDYNYTQPPYSKTQKPLPMKLMVSDKPFEEIDKAVSLIHKKVYNKL